MTYVYNGDKMRRLIQQKRVVELNITMDEASEQIGISKATLSRLENGKEPDARTFLAVGKWLPATVPFEQFYSEKKSKPKK